MIKPLLEDEQEFANELYHITEHYVKSGKLNYVEIIGILDLFKDSLPNSISFTITKPKEVHNYAD